MKEKKSPLIPKGSKPYEVNGSTFGKFMREHRKELGIPLEVAADRFGISVEYLSELENDKRYPPTGELYSKIAKFYGQIYDHSFLWLSEVAGLARKDASEDVLEFLRRNWYGRFILDLLMQANIDPTASSEMEKISATIRDNIIEAGKINGIEVKLPPIEDDDFDDEE